MCPGRRKREDKTSDHAPGAYGAFLSCGILPAAPIFLKGADMMLIDVTNFTFSYPGSFDNVFENVSFQMDTAWRLGFTGRNGRGKTTFLRCLLGELAYTGSISAPGLRFAYFPARVEDMAAPTLRALLEAVPGAEEWAILRELSRLGIREEMLARPSPAASGHGRRWRPSSPGPTAFPLSTSRQTTWIWGCGRCWGSTLRKSGGLS